MRFLSLFLLLLAAPAFAEYGNTYQVSPNYGGGANVQGYNVNNGTMWNTQIAPNGDQGGWNSKGQYWNYNQATGNYYNFATGKTCTGKGANRMCF